MTPSTSRPPSPWRSPGNLQLAELLSALSHALDITDGQPEGHGVRCCWIGMQIGREIKLGDGELWELYYVLLLKDLGCSSNASRICELYLADDIGFKRDFKVVGESLPDVLGFVVSHTGIGSGPVARLRAIAHIMRNGGRIARDLIETRCQRGADIARQMRFSEGVAAGVLSLDEHWDGGGKPEGRSGEAIPLYSRIALVAQIVEVFSASAGRAAAEAEVRDRTSTWFDPALAAAFQRVSARDGFWDGLANPDLKRLVFELEPARHVQLLDEDYLDDIAFGFAQVVDAKSPYTSGHSARVASFTDAIAETLRLPPDHRRWLRRGALLHDIGKLGVSNTILDKPGKLDAAEWTVMRRHPAHSETILARIAAFEELARMVGAHHERLDGGGYPRGVRDREISLETRMITTADIFDALTAERPYRAAMPSAKAFGIMEGDLGVAIDPDCLAALRRVIAARPDARPAGGALAA